MRCILPRVISGNRGDLASRWALLHALHRLSVEDLVVFSRFPADVPELPFQRLPYGRARNLLPDRQGREAVRRCDTVFWSVGLDMQDDSSLTRLLYIYFLFQYYRKLGKKIYCMFQGAGPISTRVGRLLASGALSAVDIFLARDAGTEKLIKDLRPRANVILGHDAIFLPGLEEDMLHPGARDHLAGYVTGSHGPFIGLNVRQWFHFQSSLLPYELARGKYLERSSERMSELISALVPVVRALREQNRARILLFSAYQPGVVAWEDDLPWLKQIKDHFPGDQEVIVVDDPISMPQYFGLMSKLDLMIGMRLHSSLTALRLGVPSLNLSYTLKGQDIYRHLGLETRVITLQQTMDSPETVIQLAQRILGDLPSEQNLVRSRVSCAVDENFALLSKLIAGLTKG